MKTKAAINTETNRDRERIRETRRGTKTDKRWKDKMIERERRRAVE